MKVLLIDVNCKNSSTGKIVYDLYQKLNNDGNEAAIAYGRGPFIAEPNIFRFSYRWEVLLDILLTRVTGYVGGFSFFATRRLLHYIDEFKPDVVNLHELHGYYVNIWKVMNYLKNKRIKTVWTFHCEFMYTGKCGYSFECEKWKTECRNCPYLHDYPKSILFDNTKKMHEKKKKIFQDFENLCIITPSGWLADRVNESFLCDKHIEIVYNGINTNIFQPLQYEHLKKEHLLQNEKIVLAIAPDLLSERKGGRWVLEIAKRMKGTNVKFILIGVKEQQEEFDSNVIMLTSILDQITLAKYYSMADVFLLCSKRETFSMTTVEALCCGTPVVGFRAGAPETIALSSFSEFVNYGDIELLEYTLKRWLDKKIDPISISKEAHALYSWENMYDNYLNIYLK